MELCVELINREQKKDSMFFPVYIVKSEGEIPQIKAAIIEKVREYNKLSQLFAEDLNKTLFSLNYIVALKPRCNAVIKTGHRETYMKSLEDELVDKQFKRL